MMIETAVEWGYTYLKLDFLFAAALPGERFDPSVGPETAYRTAFEVVRQAAGEATALLACGSPIVPSGCLTGPLFGAVHPFRRVQLARPDRGMGRSPSWENSYTAIIASLTQRTGPPRRRGSSVCSGGGTRTHNLRINSPTLCQLSYPGMKTRTGRREDTRVVARALNPGRGLDPALSSPPGSLPVSWTGPGAGASPEPWFPTDGSARVSR